MRALFRDDWGLSKFGREQLGSLLAASLIATFERLAAKCSRPRSHHGHPCVLTFPWCPSTIAVVCFDIV